MKTKKWSGRKRGGETVGEWRKNIERAQRKKDRKEEEGFTEHEEREEDRGENDGS